MFKKLALMAAFLMFAWMGTLIPAGRPAEAAPAKPSIYALANSGDVGGLWVQHKDGPCGMLVAQDLGGKKAAYFGLEASDPNKTYGLQFAIAAIDGKVMFQIRDEKGKFHFVPVEALLKLAEKETPALAEKETPARHEPVGAAVK